MSITAGAERGCCHSSRRCGGGINSGSGGVGSAGVLQPRRVVVDVVVASGGGGGAVVVTWMRWLLVAIAGPAAARARGAGAVSTGVSVYARALLRLGARGRVGSARLLGTGTMGGIRRRLDGVGGERGLSRSIT